MRDLNNKKLTYVLDQIAQLDLDDRNKVLAELLPDHNPDRLSGDKVLEIIKQYDFTPDSNEPYDRFSYGYEAYYDELGDFSVVSLEDSADKEVENGDWCVTVYHYKKHNVYVAWEYQYSSWDSDAYEEPYLVMPTIKKVWKRI